MKPSKIRKIGVTELQELKSSARRYYIVIPRKVVEAYGLIVGDLLKVDIVEASRKASEQGD